MNPDKLELVFRPKPEDVPEIMRRSELVLGQPFLELLDRPPAHKVLGTIEGRKVRREDVEMVFNDTVLMNFIYREAGRQSEDNDPPGSAMAQIRSLARELYGTFGQKIEQDFGTICMDCGDTLPFHETSCGVPARRAKSSMNKGPRPN